MISRRRFLFLLGGAATGIWLASTGLVRLERRFVVALGGSCSFCGKRSCEARTMIGTAGSPERICDECVELCFEILGEEVGFGGRLPPRALEDDAHDARIAEILRRVARSDGRHAADRAFADLQHTLAASKMQEFHCSFCGADRRDVAKLISGPRVWICDTCVGDAGAVAAHALRA